MHLTYQAWPSNVRALRCRSARIQRGSMMTLTASLLSPTLLCFGLGMASVALRSNLRLPAQIFEALSIYLLFAIGLKGGAELAEVGLGTLAAPAMAAVGLGLVIPVWCFYGLSRVGGLATADAAAVAAHYGSVSAVTFMAALSFLEARAIPYEGYVATLLALMEVPGIVVALVLARRSGEGQPLTLALREVMTGKSVVLLAGGLVIGALAGKSGLAPVRPFFGDLFLGLLCLFLLELGIVAAQRVRELIEGGWTVLVFALVAPPVHGLVGVAAGHFTGLSTGGTAVLGTLAASASYIAAPAAVRMALPQANPATALAASLAVTFPLNLSLGIPLYLEAARWLAS